MKRVVISPDHPKQKQIFDTRTRFLIAVCGRRFGKTTIAQEKVLRKMHLTDRSVSWIIAPTREMVKDLYWEQLKDRCDRLKWKVRKNESELWIERLSNRSKVFLKSGDRPDRLRGRGLDLVIPDEYADMEPTMFDEVLRPALADRMGEAWFLGTPSGRNHFYEMFIQAGTKPDWSRYQFKTIDNPYIPREEIEHMRANMDERAFKQEVEADFVEYLGAAYSYHDPTIHRVRKEFRPEMPIVVCCDFNIDPCIWELAQEGPDYEYFFGEICQHQTTTWRMCAEAKKRIVALFGEGRAREHPLHFYGDYTSNKRRDVSAVESSWGIIREQFEGWNAQFFLRANPRIVDRLNAMNAMMRSAAGVVRLFYSPDCVELGKDFDMCSMDDVLKEKEVGDRTHAADGAGYYIDYKHPIVKPMGIQYVN